MTEQPWGDAPEDHVEDDGVLDASDTLMSEDVREDPLDAGIIPADRWSRGTGLTAEEEERGPSLDEQLAEEVPDPALTGLDEEYSGERQERSGRLADDQEYDGTLTGHSVGIDGGAAGAEEAAMHITDEDADRAAELSDASEDETLDQAVQAVADDQARDARP